MDAEIDAEEDRLAQEFDEIILELLKDELAKTKSEKTKAQMKLLELFHELSPDDPDFVEDMLFEASNKSDLREGTSDRYVRDALLAWRRRDHKTALDLFTKCIELDPNDGIAFLNRGNLQLEMGYFEDGIGDLERARDIDPKLPWQNALVFKMLEPEERERTRQAMLRESQGKEPDQRP
jgi:tetratricopeptide (TPR) repeat protein